MSVEETATRPVAGSYTVPGRSRLRALSEGGALRTTILAAFLIALIIYFTARSSHFLTGSNALIVVTSSAVLALVSVGQTLTIVAGCFDLSVGGIAPLAGVVFALIANSGLSLTASIAAVLLLGAVCGLVNGVIVTFFKINPFIATLATTSVASGLALTISNGVQIPFNRESEAAIAATSALGVNNYVWVLIGLVIVVHVCLQTSVFGRYLYATGGNSEAARLAGIRINGVVTCVYILSGMFAGLAGIVLASQLQTGSGTAGSDLGLRSITAVILGGAALAGGLGGMPGTMLGVLILGVLANGMTLLGVSSFYQTIATGVVLLLAVGVSRIHRLPRATKRPRPIAVASPPPTERNTE